MQVSIDFNPQVSAQLARAAMRRGIDLARFVESLIADSLPLIEPSPGSDIPHPKYSTPEEHVAAMDAVAARNADLPVLPDSAFDRENVY